ncbi:MAG: hypothetical protein R6U86_08885, partial [Bacteroidales bacterium]
REAEPYDEVKVMQRIAPKGEATVIAHLNHLIDHDQADFVTQGIQYIKDNKLDIDLSKLKKKPQMEEILAGNNENKGNDGENKGYGGEHGHALHGTHGHPGREIGIAGNGPGHAGGHEHGHGGGHDHKNGGGCPGSRMMSFAPPAAAASASPEATSADQPSALRQWPVQLHLVNPQAPYFQEADVLLAADCVAFSMGNFHSKYLRDKGLAIACPKLDSGKDVYIEKLTTMIDQAGINTLTVMMMEVPCCSGLLQMAKMASEKASRKVPIKAMIVGLDGQIRKEEWI